MLAQPESRARECLDSEGALHGQRFAYVPDGGTKAYEGKEDLLDALQTGILSRKVVRFWYKDSHGRARSGDLFSGAPTRKPSSRRSWPP